MNNKDGWRDLSSIIVGIGLGLIIVIFLFVTANYLRILPLSNIPGLGWLPQQPIIKPPNQMPPEQLKSTFSFEGCSISKAENPLVDDVRTLGNGTVVGTFRGNIQSINLDAIGKFSSLELISPNAAQRHTFQLQEEQGLVYDAIDQKDLKLAGLTRGMTVVLSFNCFPDKGNLFKITRVAVTGKQT